MENTALIDSMQSAWVEVRDTGSLSDVAILDQLLQRIGQEGAPGYECGVLDTFSIFDKNEDAKIILSTGEETTSDTEARFIGNLLAIRLFLAAGFIFDAKIISALASTYGLSWTKKIGGNYGHSSLSLSISLWLIALDPKPESDEPFNINWELECFQNNELWDLDYNLFSRYDIKERMLDWCIYAVNNEDTMRGISIFTILEPLLQLRNDSRAKIVIDKFSDLNDHHESKSASTLIEKKRISDLINKIVY
tara:strand:- start:3138 stop:3887 length:750 start_codon:yes stop_codon:yes gene_type:complete